VRLAEGTGTAKRPELRAASRAAAAESEASLGVDPGLEGLSVTGRNVRKPKAPKEPALVQLYVIPRRDLWTSHDRALRIPYRGSAVKAMI